MNELVTAASALAMSPQVLADLGHLAKILLGRPFEVAGEMMGDTVYGWQVRNRVRILEKTKKLLDEKGISPDILPEGFLVSLLRNAGDVEEESLQNRWAQLLASAIEDEQFQHPGLIRVLSEMSPLDARLFSVVVKDLEDGGTAHTRFKAAEDLAASSSVKAVVLSMRSLERLAICTDVMRYGNSMLFEEVHHVGHLEVTTFGVFFAEAVLGSRFPEQTMERRNHG